MGNNVREEKQIFGDLVKLCTSPGYAHVIAYFCFKDNIIGYADKIKPEDILDKYSNERLVRTEISTLIGLLFKKEIDFNLPKPDKMQKLIEETEFLLKEIHQSMMVPMIADFDPSKINQEGFNPFAKGSAMREPIFYCGESAYNFQYLDFTPKKYTKDDHWIKRNKGFSINDAREVIRCIADIQNKKMMSNLEELKRKTADGWTMFPAFTFTTSEIVSQSDLDRSIIDKVLKAFTPSDGMRNQEFNALNDFNITNAYPILDLGSEKYLLFQYYSLVEALYETPFYWLISDQSYSNEAMKNRGFFTENFSKEKLESVFGKKRVFSNINIIDSNKNIAGEIDVLVVFANRAIVLQAKSKRLTIESRKGNDSTIKDDFKKSIQDSYDQALSCSKLITDKKYKLFDANGVEINISREFKEIYIFCIVSDHYPALSFQTHQFLNYQKTEIILPPFIMDVFLLDVMSEMLHTPLLFLSYVNRRMLFFEKIIASHELTILSYHLKQNLWVDSEYDMFCLSDDISVDLDVAMLVRREGLPGDATPEGILTRSKDTMISRLINEIEMMENPGTIDLGFVLLSLSEDTIYEISNGIENIANLARADGKHHDFTVEIGGVSTGLTIHCNNDPMNVAGKKLESHCVIRKYTQKAKSWFGICLDPDSLSIRFGLGLDYEWKWSVDMEDIARHFPVGHRISNFGTKEITSRKIGRNELCPCGSGVKYKKCCIDR